MLATDDAEEALDLLRRNAAENDLEVETGRVDWTDPGALLARAPFDLVLAADLLYERANVGPLLALLPRLAKEVWLADPGRAAARAFLDQAQSRWSIETSERAVVRLHRLTLRNGSTVAR